MIIQTLKNVLRYLFLEENLRIHIDRELQKFANHDVKLVDEHADHANEHRGPKESPSLQKLFLVAQIRLESENGNDTFVLALAMCGTPQTVDQLAKSLRICRNPMTLGTGRT